MLPLLHDERYRQAFKGVLNLRQSGSTSNNDALTYLLRISVFCIQGPITMPRDNAHPYLPTDDNKPDIRTLHMLLLLYFRDILLILRYMSACLISKLKPKLWHQRPKRIKNTMTTLPESSMTLALIYMQKLLNLQLKNWKKKELECARYWIGGLCLL